MILELTDKEVEYLSKKIQMSRFTLEDHYIAEGILVKLGVLEVVKLKRKSSSTGYTQVHRLNCTSA